jgi:hypothetical protein
MSGIKISDLPAADAALGAMQLEVNDDGTSRRVTADQVKAFAVDVATDANLRAGAAGKLVDAAGVYTASAVVTLTDGGTITPDFNAGRNFVVTLAGNRILANPTNQAAGQSGLVIVKQDATGSRTLSYGSAWKFSGGAPTLSTTANSVDVISYYVESSGTIIATFSEAFS